MPVTLHVTDGVAVVTLSHPPLNVIDRALRDGLADASRRIARRTDVRAVVLDGGEVFSSGADVEEMLPMSPAEAGAHVRRLQEALTAVAELPQPVVAAVAGYALGAGCELALCADLRVAAPNVVLGMPETRLGVIPAAGGTQRLPRLIGPSRAKDLIFSGRSVRAAEALAIGLVDRVVPAGELDVRARAWARSLAAARCPSRPAAGARARVPRTHRAPAPPSAPHPNRHTGSAPVGGPMRPAFPAASDRYEPSRTVVHAFPAQGDFALSPLVRALTASRDLRAAVRAVTALTDPAVAEFGIAPLGPRLLSDSPPVLGDLFTEATGSPQYALYVSSLAIHLALSSLDRAPDRLLGMSFGDVAACAAAGALRWADGARVACLAAQALSRCTGVMLLAEGSGAGSRGLEELVRDTLNGASRRNVVVACVNHPGQLVLSGPGPAVTAVADRLEQQHVRTTLLRLPFLAHHPALTSAAADFRRAIRHIPCAPPRLPAYSSVLKRPYRADEDLPAALARGLIEPAHLPDALQQAAGRGPALILEAGTGRALTDSAARTLPGATMVARTGLDVLAARPRTEPAAPGNRRPDDCAPATEAGHGA